MKKLFVLILALILAVSAVACQDTPETSLPPVGGETSSNVSETVSLAPEESIIPDIQITATASIGSSGDILIHNAVRQSGYDAQTGTFDYSYAFQYLAPFVQRLDYAVVNAEFSVSANGTYASLPFRVPSEVVKALSECGYDLGITANNHIQDGGIAGIKKTITTLTEYGMDYTGSRLNDTDTRYLIKDINGIKIGVLNYSYGSYWNTNGFDETKLDSFYIEAQALINNMRADGAEFIFLYIHWGKEYSLEPNDTQRQIAQKMCDFGVDVIIGGHPHKIQPLEMLNSDISGKTTICLYSMGNLYSGQQIECMAGGTQANSPYCFQDPWHFAGCDYPDVADRTLDEHRLEHGVNCNDNGHTEDGVVFTVNLCRYEDGTAAISSVEVLPVWCMGRGFIRASYPTNSYFSEYYAIPLDKTINWAEEYGLDGTEAKEAMYSYDRTTQLLSDGINEINTYLEEQYNQHNTQFKEGLEK